jgi:uncharacterized protein (DUF433 family)
MIAVIGTRMGRVEQGTKAISSPCADGLREPPGSVGKAGKFYRSRWIRTGHWFILGNTQWSVSRREMTYLDRITFNPEQCGGRPCIRGMRIRVKDVLDLLAAGLSEKEILEDYPDLEAEDIKACLQYAAAQADHAVLRVP